MANNRMWLVHKSTGRAVLLAKFYPSAGWYHPAPETAGQKLNAFLDETESDIADETEWELRYESEADFTYTHDANEPVRVTRKE